MKSGYNYNCKRFETLCKSYPSFSISALQTVRQINMAQCELSLKTMIWMILFNFSFLFFWQCPFLMVIHESILQIQIESWCKSYPSLQKKSCILTWTVKLPLYWKTEKGNSLNSIIMMAQEFKYIIHECYVDCLYSMHCLKQTNNGMFPLDALLNSLFKNLKCYLHKNKRT